MKSILTLVVVSLLLGLPPQLSGQENQKGDLRFHLLGELRGITSGTLIIQFGGVKKECKIVDGKFELFDKISQPTLATIWIKPKSTAAVFYLDEGEIALTGFVEKASSTTSNELAYRLAIKKISGSRTEEIRQNYQFFYQQNKSLVDFQIKLFKYLDSRITQNEDNPFWGAAIAELAVVERVLNHKQLIILSRKLDISKMEKDDVAMMKTGLMASRKHSVGDEFPGFKLPDINGAFTGPTNFRGKYLLVDFWASWCTPCRVKHRILAETKSEDRTFEILSISIDDEALAWRKAIRADKTTWTNVLDREKEIANKLAIFGVPTNFLLDKNGKILAVNVSLDEINKLTKK